MDEHLAITREHRSVLLQRERKRPVLSVHYWVENSQIRVAECDGRLKGHGRFEKPIHACRAIAVRDTRLDSSHRQ
jgi:hypothetical protein